MLGDTKTGVHNWPIGIAHPAQVIQKSLYDHFRMNFPRVRVGVELTIGQTTFDVAFEPDEQALYVTVGNELLDLPDETYLHIRDEFRLAYAKRLRRVMRYDSSWRDDDY